MPPTPIWRSRRWSRYWLPRFMSPSIEYYQPSADVLPFRMAEVVRLLGYDAKVPDYVQQALDDLWLQTQERVAVQCGYVRREIAVEPQGFTCIDQTFACGVLIGHHLQEAREVAVFAATLGPEFDRWSEAFFRQSDPFQGYLSNMIGSILAESVVDWLESCLQVELDFDDLYRSKRLSPGYCQWDVAEQQKLFALLPPQFCGITLNDSSLMSPIKSVSGIIGIGPSLKRQDYGCGRCDRHDCVMRKDR